MQNLLIIMSNHTSPNMKQFIYPHTLSYDFDRNRRHVFYYYYDKYYPTVGKQLLCWIMNEKLKPVDWEEVPPFKELLNDEGYLIPERDSNVFPIFECVSQPNMLTQNAIWFRRGILFGTLLLIGRRLKKERPGANSEKKIISVLFLNQGIVGKGFLFCWFAYIISKNYISKDWQMPFN